MTATVLPLSAARDAREHRRQSALTQTLSARLDGDLVVDEKGRLDVAFVDMLQAKVDALGLDVNVDTLTATQAASLVALTNTWGFLVRRRIGLQGEQADSPKEAYLLGVAAGQPRRAPLAPELAAAVQAALCEKEQAAAPERQLRLVNTA